MRYLRLEEYHVNSCALLFYTVVVYRPIPVAARSNAWVCGRSLAGIVGSYPVGGMDVYCECCVLSGLGNKLITRPEMSYRVWCVCDREASIMRP